MTFSENAKIAIKPRVGHTDDGRTLQLAQICRGRARLTIARDDALPLANALADWIESQDGQR